MHLLDGHFFRIPHRANKRRRPSGRRTPLYKRIKNIKMCMGKETIVTYRLKVSSMIDFFRGWSFGGLRLYIQVQLCSFQRLGRMSVRVRFQVIVSVRHLACKQTFYGALFKKVSQNKTLRLKFWSKIFKLNFLYLQWHRYWRFLLCLWTQ